MAHTTFNITLVYQFLLVYTMIVCISSNHFVEWYAPLSIEMNLKKKIYFKMHRFAYICQYAIMASFRNTNLMI